MSTNDRTVLLLGLALLVATGLSSCGGDGSAVSCPTSGGCDVVCNDDCAVDRPGHPDTDFASDLTSCESVIECPGDVLRRVPLTGRGQAARYAASGFQ
jgi:hypothetical protein